MAPHSTVPVNFVLARLVVGAALSYLYQEIGSNARLPITKSHGSTNCCPGVTLRSERNSYTPNRARAPTPDGHGSQGCVEVSQKGDETLWPTLGDRDGPASVVPRGDEGCWCLGSPSLRTVAQQSGRKLASTVPTTRGCDGEIPEYQDPAKIRFRPRLDPKPFQPRPTPKPPRHFQEEPLSCFGRVASTGGLSVATSRALETDSH